MGIRHFPGDGDGPNLDCIVSLRVGSGSGLSGEAESYAAQDVQGGLWGQGQTEAWLGHQPASHCLGLDQGSWLSTGQSAMNSAPAFSVLVGPPYADLQGMLHRSVVLSSSLQTVA